MPFSLYDVSVPPMIKSLKMLSSILKKGEEHAASDPAKITESRLIEDMQPLTYQIQRISDTAKGIAVRVAGAEPEAWADEEKTFSELQERIAKTIAFLEKVDPKSTDGKEDNEIEVFGQKFKASIYVLEFGLPNFYFHVVTTYALLRKEGVQVGKRDFLAFN